MQSEIISAILGGIGMGLYMAISVGPTLFAVIRYSMENSYKAGLAFVLGVSASDIMYVTLANMATGWLKGLGTYTYYIGIGGSIVLMVVGISGFLRKAAPQQQQLQAQPTISGAHYMRIWGSGFLINTINPGVIVSWLGGVTSVATKDAGYRLVFFGVCLTLVLSIDFLKVFLAERIKKLLTPERLVNVQKTSSLIIAAVGLVLLVKTLLDGK